MIDSDIPNFDSFVMAGFECTYALNKRKKRLDLLAATKHDIRVENDYQMLIDSGFKTVREGFSWSQIDKGRETYDFSRYVPMLEAGQKLAIQQIWDLNHFDFPTDLDVFSSEFVTRFATYAQAVVKLLRQYTSRTIYIVPVNEISFFSWIGGEKGWWAPFAKGKTKGMAFKTQLVRAAIAAMESIWEVENDVRFIHVDPFMRRIAKEPVGRTALRHVKEFNERVRFEAWDMLVGKSHPEVGGDPKYLDIIGVNYYIHNQEWVITPRSKGKHLRHQRIGWESPDRISFALMLNDIYQRYGRPMVVTETGSFGENREKWWARVLSEIDEALSMDLPLAGVCAYPIIDRPNSAGFLLPNSGLWDFEIDDHDCQRIPHTQSLDLVTSYNEKYNNKSRFSSV